MEKKWEEIYAFISAGSYPSGYDKAQRQNLRRYASRFKQKELFVGTRRVVKTMDDARKIFHEFHSSAIGGHTGSYKTLNAVCSRFYWFGMTVDIKTWVCINCLYCLWELIGMDLTGPLPKTSSGFQYILTATDYFSKWVEAFPLKTKSASEVAEHLCSIIYRHGYFFLCLYKKYKTPCPYLLKLNSDLCKLLQIERSVTAAYHPQTNGLDEKTNDNIKRYDLYLDPTLFSLRSKVHTTTKYSPFFLMYGREAVFPSEVPAQSESEAKHAVKETAHENIVKSQDKQKVAYTKQVLKKYKNVVYNVGGQILLLNMRKRGQKGRRLEQDFSGPYTIDEISGKCVRLKYAEGNTLKSLYSIDHIKPYRRSHPVQVSTPSKPVESIPSSEMWPCSPQHHHEALAPVTPPETQHPRKRWHS
uniref:Integrase catalytic domain-containing protein n=1 Tax=Nothobranchius furzeri TaxID=105023 RepID=A0A8C6KZN4_NOTFU